MKRLVKNALSRLGLDVQRTRPFGTDVFRDIRKALLPGRVELALDVGANIGQTAIEFLENFPRARIHSFEPNPEPYRQLADRVRHSKRVFLHQAALGSSTGRARLHVTNSSLTSSLLPVSTEAGHFLGDLVNDAGSVEVEVRALDDFLRQEKIEHLDLLKLDVQGFEAELLKGAERSLSENRVSLILTELNFVPLYKGQAFFQDIYKLLLDRNLRLVALYHGDYRDGPYLAWCNGLFINTDAVQRKRRLCANAR